jgi:hypothetical protein
MFVSSRSRHQLCALPEEWHDPRHSIPSRRVFVSECDVWTLGLVVLVCADWQTGCVGLYGYPVPWCGTGMPGFVLL